MLEIEIQETEPTVTERAAGILRMRYIHFTCVHCGIGQIRRIKNKCTRSFDSLLGSCCYECDARMPDVERMRDQMNRRLSYLINGY